MDEVITWAKPSQNRHELKRLIAELEMIQPLTILEIGVDQGGSLKIWRAIFDPAVLIGVDINPVELNFDARLIVGDSRNKAVFNQIQKRLDDSKLDFLFIDGDHSWAGVSNDFATYAPLVREGGIIAFHDIKVDPGLYPAGEMDVLGFWTQLKREITRDEIYDDWDYKEFWDEAGHGTGTGIVFVGSQ